MELQEQDVPENLVTKGQRPDHPNPESRQLLKSETQARSSVIVNHNNNVIEPSLSRDASQVSGLTFAALEVINSSDAVAPIKDEAASPTNSPEPREVKSESSLFPPQEGSFMYMMNEQPHRPLAQTMNADHLHHDPEEFKSLAPLVNVSLREAPSLPVPSPLSMTLLSAQTSRPVLTDLTIPKPPELSEEPLRKRLRVDQEAVNPVPPTPKPKATRGRRRKNHDQDTPKERKGTREVINRPPPHVLPPCKVCGVQATGFHYGVNTCEACKGFYRRSIIRKQPYACANNPVKCKISPGKRNTCPACRYKKCEEAGMSVEGIKIGRYTYAKRTQDILELQTHPPSPDVPPDDDSSDVMLMGTMSEEELLEFIQVVVEANESKQEESLKNLDFVEQIQNQIKEQITTGQGPSSTKVPMEEFLTVLNTTGVQLDDRFQILQQWIGVLNDGLRFVISFAKDVPGFKELSMTDQMALIKHSICEVWLISRHRAVHKDYDLFTTRTGMTLDIVKALGEDFGNCVVRLSRRLRSLDLTIEETIMLKAMVIFFTDRCSVEEPDRVTAIQGRILDSLLYLFSLRNVNMARTLGNLSAILTELRNMNEFYQNYTKKLKIISSNTGVVDLPPLFLEIITFS